MVSNVCITLYVLVGALIGLFKNRHKRPYVTKRFITSSDKNEINYGYVFNTGSFFLLIIFSMLGNRFFEIQFIMNPLING